MRRVGSTAAAILAVLLLGALAAPEAPAAQPFAVRCPPMVPEEGSIAKLNQNPAAEKAIVPAGATSARLCRYWGFSGASGRQTPKTQTRVGKLRDQVTLRSRDTVESLTLEFEELEVVKPGSYSCPEDEGAVLYAAFTYPAAKPVILEVPLSGCEFVGNGHAKSRALNGSLRKKLERLIEGGEGKRSHRGTVHEKRAVAYPPPHLTYGKARHEAKAGMELFCEESGLCRSLSVGRCVRKRANAYRCRYRATLKTGEACRGGINVTIWRDRTLMISPGVLNDDEKCSFIFAPPGSREELEEIESEEAQEPKPGRSRRAIGESG